MTKKDYIELLDYIDTKMLQFDKVVVNNIHSTYNPTNHQISKITFKIYYTKDGNPVPNIINGKLPKNVIEKSEGFKGSECNLKEIKKWYKDFIKEKGFIE